MPEKGKGSANAALESLAKQTAASIEARRAELR
jgi:hypothetical protein